MDSMPPWALYAIEKFQEQANGCTGKRGLSGSAWVTNDRHKEVTSWLNNEQLRAVYREWVDHPRIGPTAPGDGDIVSWSLGAIEICLADFILTDRHSPHPRQPIGPQPSEPPKTRGLLAYVRWVGVVIFRRQFEADKTAPIESWAQHYRMLERSMQNLWGGRRVRVHVRAKTLTKPARLVADALSQGILIPDIPSVTGLSRATVYRLLKRKD
jgi:hypothetical protein